MRPNGSILKQRGRMHRLAQAVSHRTFGWEVLAVATRASKGPACRHGERVRRARLVQVHVPEGRR